MPWRFDPEHSQITWACRYLGISVIKGSFERVTAMVDVEDPDPTKWSISAEIDPTSVTSPGLERRQEAMAGENFLYAARFPELGFKSTHIQPNGGDLEITGHLTLHGVTQPVIIRGRDNGEAIDRRGVRRRGFSGATSISRTAFDIPATGPTLVADQVDISLEVQLVWED